MPSPFPGLDPFLEGQMWADFHRSFIPKLRGTLQRALPDAYTAHIEEYVYLTLSGGRRIRRIEPDVFVLDGVPLSRPQSGTRTATISPPVTVPVAFGAPEERRQLQIEVRFRQTSEVVTVLEMLSPENKRAPGRVQYLKKRDKLLDSRTHLVELDLLRGGARPPMARPLPRGDYFVMASRWEQRPQANVWAFTLRERMPVIGIPLAGEDADVPLDLQAAFAATWQEAVYDRLVHYDRDPEPRLSPADLEWVREILK